MINKHCLSNYPPLWKMGDRGDLQKTALEKSPPAPLFQRGEVNADDFPSPLCKKRKLTAYLYIFPLLLSTSPPAWAEDVFEVLSSTASAYQKGDKIATDTTVELTRGETLRLRDPGQKRCTLQGPYQAKPECPGLAKSLARLKPRLRSSRDGMPDVWAIDAAQPGIRCYPAGAPPILWRADAGEPEQLRIHDQQTQAGFTISWPAGESTLEWPLQEIPLTDGGLYLLQSAQRNTLVSLYAVPQALADAGEKAVWMAQHGCQQQLEQVLEDTPAEKALEAE